MKQRDEDFDLDAAIGFAQKPEEQALHEVWSAMNEAMLQAMTAIHAGADENGKLSVIADSLEQGMKAIAKVGPLLGLSFIPPKRENRDQGTQDCEEGNVPF